METTINYRLLTKIFSSILLAGLFVSGNVIIFVLTYVFVYVIMLSRAFLTPSSKRLKFFLILTYTVLLSLQLTSVILVVFPGQPYSFINAYLLRLFGALFVISPWLIERIFTSRTQTSFVMPSIQELGSISLAEVKENRDKIMEYADNIRKSGEVLSVDNITEIVSDLPRHDSFNYVNNGSLTHEYFALAENCLDDKYIYIVLSDTGSPASSIISIFTSKPYNHVSLSFDKDLKTIISYNGGEKVYPPGLNREMLAFFNKKEDASIIIYRLKIREAQKQLLIDKVKEINEEGSAYNLMGLVTKHSGRPNILFCSQFVYKMLKEAGLEYFNKKDGEVKPTDFVELDYHRKLEYVSEISFRDSQDRTQ